MYGMDRVTAIQCFVDSCNSILPASCASSLSMFVSSFVAPDAYSSLLKYKCPYSVKRCSSSYSYSYSYSNDARNPSTSTSTADG